MCHELHMSQLSREFLKMHLSEKPRNESRQLHYIHLNEPTHDMSHELLIWSHEIHMSHELCMSHGLQISHELSVSQGVV